jgi:hypothetical protein
MRKSVILFIAVAVSLLLFTLLAKVFKGVSYALVDRICEEDYLRPSSKDSAYMQLLQDTLYRPAAMSLSNELRPFYITADSIRHILRTDLSGELAADIIVSMDYAHLLRQELLRLQTDSIIFCPSDCLPPSLHHSREAWEQHFTSPDKKAVSTFVESQIACVELGELAALRRMLLLEE